MILQSLKDGPGEFFHEDPVADTNPLIATTRRRCEFSELSNKQKDRLKVDKLACSYMLQDLINEMYTSIDSHRTAKGDVGWNFNTNAMNRFGC